MISAVDTIVTVNSQIFMYDRICERHIFELRTEAYYMVCSSQLLLTLVTKEILKISKLDSSTGRALHQFAEFLGSNPVQAWNFLRLSFVTA